MPSNITLSRIDYALQILTNMGGADLENLHRLRSHPAHFIRWNAVRSLALIDLEAGLEALNQATTDHHAEVRAAAARSLAAYAASSANQTGG